MLSLSFRFIAGRYHATKWGTNVNEGMVDWPPSPWRILRAIISAWKSKASHIPDNTMRPILESMSKSQVLFDVPRATHGHTRHYMPAKDGKTTKVIDSFLAVDPNAMLVATWSDVLLDDNQEKVLDEVVGNIGYLGRAESWCEAEIRKDQKLHNCVPLGTDTGGGSMTEILVPTPDATLEDLCRTTEDTHSKGRIYPPSSTRVAYVLPKGCFDVETKPNVAPVTPKAEVLRYRIVGNVRPRVTESMLVGDFIRRVAMSKYGENNDGKVSRTISGKDGDGNHLTGHVHAFFIPTDEDGDKILDHFTVVSDKPLEKEDFDALVSMTQIRYGGKWFGLIYNGCGRKSDFATVPILQRSKRWISATPFVLNRHPKTKRGLDTNVDEARKQILLELGRRFGNTASKIEIRGSKSKMLNGLMPIQFKRWRKDGIFGIGAYQVSIEFDNEIHGPLSLGHGAHFGLGLFIPSPP